MCRHNLRPYQKNRYRLFDYRPAQRIGRACGASTSHGLLADKASAPRHLSTDEQPTWIDPASGYRRRQIYLSARLPLELVEVLLPRGAVVSAPASAYTLIRQVTWVLEGRVIIDEGGEPTALETGDSLEFGAPSDVQFRNESVRPCRYLVAVVRQ
jgi:mannose-6-phosphate isomerase-like protein (cupin superfamily)